MPKTAESFLFDFFTKAATKIFADYTDVFVCPLCLQTFDSLADLNKAHLWPEALGGRVFTLTCRKCNSKVGSRIERHEVQRVKRFSQKSTPFRQKINGIEGDVGGFFSSRYENEQAEVYLDFDKNHSNPKALDELWKLFETGKIVNKEVTWTFDTGFDKNIAPFTFLHFAYMTLFHLTGYSWVATAIAKDIRQQLNHPREGKFPVFLVPFTSQEVLGSAGATEPILMEVLSPFEVRGFLVATPELTYKNNQRTAIWIPKVFDDRSSIYRLDKSQGTRFNYRFLTSVGREPGKLFCYEGPVQ